ncbi:KxYKxGKxW signal peptide domain-containing protein, partial [Enterococcus sp. 3H8_DIV0648]|uniref:KxYKxGKxW signal peptide domain-containing protein n=3 Tax=Enterococcus TaxID=1350 RepID=UPI000B6BEA1F
MSKRKLVYRREPIKKYRMHKVKKHWVVKSGVAGAMIVGTVAAPASSFIAQAAEADVMEDGEAFQTQDLERTVDSSIPEMGETPVTTSEEEESEEEQTEETTSTEEPEGKTEETTEKETKSKTARTSESSEKQTRATENEDGTKTWVANEDSEVKVSNVKRLKSDGSVAKPEYTIEKYDAGLSFTFEVDNSKESINVGDKIIIPIYGNSQSNNGLATFNQLAGDIPGIGTVKYISDDVGFELLVAKEIDGRERAQVVMPGQSWNFPKYYSSESKQLECLPIDIFLSGEKIETLTTTFVKSAISAINRSLTHNASARAD